jgi:SAM-dependent methyltransferase
MQVLSIVQWHHFAYMVISVALLGFGAAGTFLALWREPLLRRSAILLPALMLATGLAMAVLVDAVQLPAVRFDSYLLFADYRHLGRLLLTYLFFFVPFFLGALAIGIIFVLEAGRIGKIYFANLLGSGLGGLLALGLAWWLVPAQSPAVVAVLPALAAVLLLPRQGRGALSLLALLTVAITAWKVVQPPTLQPSQYKDLSKTLLLPEATITRERSSPYGLVQTLSSPVLRYAPGLSLAAGQTADVKLAAFVNGDWYGALMDYRPGDTTIVLDYTTMALPYAMRRRGRVLVLRSGSGTDVAHALSEGASRVTAVEPNAPVLSLFRGELASLSDSLFYQRGVTVKAMEPRTFLLMDTGRYDLIVLPMVGTFGGSSGLYALQEQFILTREAFGEMWHRLQPGGVLAISSWMDYPFRNPLKVLATLVEVLRAEGVQDPALHLAAVRSWGTITYVLTRTPLSAGEVANIRTFCAAVQFDPALLPGLEGEERTGYNQLGDPRFFTYVDGLLSGERDQLYADYDFNIRPATDNRPYFSQYIKWGSLQRLAGFFGNRSLPFFEVGYVLVVVTLLQVALLSFVLIVLPLFRLGWRGGGKGRTLLYFSGIGLGYMFVEMILIQRFTLYFGNPVYAASAAITVLLVASGAGSYVSAYWGGQRQRLLAVLGAIVALLLIYSFALTPLLRQTIHLSPLVKAGVAFLLVAPLAFLMGIPFPAGIAQVSKRGPEVIPWAWGVNGCTSVVSTALATITAVELGATWVMVVAAGAYGLTLLTQLNARPVP